METKFKFTKKAIDQVPIPEKRLRLRDEGVPGLVLDITPSGTRTFRVYKKLKGHKSPVNVSLGKYPSISIENARNLAKETLGKMSQGVNPNEQARSERRSQITLRQAFYDYTASRPLAGSTARDYKAAVEKYLKDYADKPLLNITEEVVKREHAKVTKFSPAQADAIMRLLRAVFNFAKYEYRGVGNKFIFDLNPVEILGHHRLWNNVGRRNTRITQGQLPAWFKGLEKIREGGDDFAIAVCDLAEMGLLTGLRRSELLSLKWDQVNLKERTYYLSKTKNGDPLELPISERVFELLNRRNGYQDAKGFVFNADNKYGVVKEPKKVLTKIREETGIEFSLHDLRRTFTTTAESINIGPYMIKRLLNHRTRRDDVTAGYIVLTPEELRTPAQNIENEILKHAGLAKPTETNRNIAELFDSLSEKQKSELLKLISNE